MKQSSKVFRRLGVGLAVLALLALAGFLFASLKASNKLSRRWDTHRLDIPVPNPLTDGELAALRAEHAGSDAGAQGDAGADSDPLAGLDLASLATERAIARGKHLVEGRYGCNGCHGENLAGGVMIDDPAIGSIRAPNLTKGKGGRVAGYTIADWDRIVRHGVKPDGSPAVMPSEDYFAMSDHELSDVVAYIRSLPAVEAEIPAPSFGPVGKVLLALDKFPISAEKVANHGAAHGQKAPDAADTAAFGAHLAATCTGCHRANLAGGPMTFGPPGWPAAANLTRDATGLADWSFEDFEKALTQGIRKGGRALREPMTHVLPGTRAMTDLERKALWTYLGTLNPLPTNP
jgi:cytochrome c5